MRSCVSGVCTEMIPLRVVHIEGGSIDPNWELDEFRMKWFNADYERINEIVKLNEHKSVGEHSKQVYDWEILELFFCHHNLAPHFPESMHNQKLSHVEQKISMVSNES